MDFALPPCPQIIEADDNLSIVHPYLRFAGSDLWVIRREEGMEIVVMRRSGLSASEKATTT